MSLTLYHAVPSRSAIVRWMLEEVGAPYEVRLIDFKSGENRRPEYLQINPMGKVPALEHDGVIITEAAAICCYLADAFPEARLNVPVSDRRRGPYLKWLFFGPSCLEPATVEVMLKREPGPRGQLGWGDQELVLSVLRDALQEEPWLLGDHFTAADVVIGSGLRWGMMTKAIPERPEFVAYVGRLAERPALRRAMQKDAELMQGAS
jgi:glutathione S-transferase